MSPAFALTDYKILGSTYQNVVVDLHYPSCARGEDALHKRYCSMVVQLLRPRSMEGLHLLKPLSLRDLEYRPHPKLREEDERLQKLADETMHLWTEADLDGSET